MNAVLYCYDWDSIRGYTYAYADTKQRRVFSYAQAQTQFPDAVIRLISHGGASLACGFDEQTENYFLVLKGLNAGKKDMDGRETDANIAFLSPDAEEVSAFTKGLLAQYIAVETAFQNLLTPDASNTVGYGIDFDLFTNVIESCIALGKEPDTRPVWEKNIRFTRSKPLSFVVTEFGLPYFLKMLRVESSDITSHVDASGKSFSAFLQNTRAKLFPVEIEKTDADAQGAKIPTLEVQLKEVESRRSADPDRTERQIEELKNSVEALRKQVNELPKTPVRSDQSQSVTSIQNNLSELEKRVAELENKQNQTPPSQTDDREGRKIRDEQKRMKQDTKDQEKKSRILLFAVLIIAVLALILSIITISKKGDSTSWQTSYTDSTYQSSDTPQTLQP